MREGGNNLSELNISDSTIEFLDDGNIESYSDCSEILNEITTGSQCSKLFSCIKKGLIFFTEQVKDILDSIHKLQTNTNTLSSDMNNIKTTINYLKNVDLKVTDIGTTTYTFPSDGCWLLISSHPPSNRGLYIVSVYSKKKTTINTVLNDPGLTITFAGLKMTVVSMTTARLWGICVESL